MCSRSEQNRGIESRGSHNRGIQVDDGEDDKFTNSYIVQGYYVYIPFKVPSAIPRVGGCKQVELAEKILYERHRRRSNYTS
jgi:hypothetical protein